MHSAECLTFSIVILEIDSRYKRFELFMKLDDKGTLRCQERRTTMKLTTLGIYYFAWRRKASTKYFIVIFFCYDCHV